MIRELLKEALDLFCQERRLRRISRAAGKYRRIAGNARRQAHIVHILVARYNAIYKNDPIEFKEK